MCKTGEWDFKQTSLCVCVCVCVCVTSIDAYQPAVLWHSSSCHVGLSTPDPSGSSTLTAPLRKASWQMTWETYGTRWGQELKESEKHWETYWGSPCFCKLPIIKYIGTFDHLTHLKRFDQWYCSLIYESQIKIHLYLTLIRWSQMSNYIELNYIMFPLQLLFPLALSSH